MEIKTPTLDTAALEKASLEFAMKGAIETIKDFYSGYNSPYRKALQKTLEDQSVNVHVGLPDIIAVMNDSLSKEVDRIANESIAKTFIPLLKEFLTNGPAEITFTEILREFLKHEYEPKQEDYSCEIEDKSRENKIYSWLNVTLNKGGDESYSLTLHRDSDAEKEGKKKYKIYSLPDAYSSKNNYPKTMKLSLKTETGAATLEIPFTRDIIKDRFNSFIARLVMAETIITMDTDDFEEDMFPKHCHCD